jgi:DNA helicase-2/ATP-dependent DNA helicase PcrA
MKKYYNAKYSIIKYCDEIMEEDIEEVLYYLSNGIIIHLFSKGNFKEELELNGYLEEEFLYARKNGFLYIYEEQNNIYDDNIIIAVDGQVLEKHIYINICDDKENGFNHEQYNIVTATTDSNIIVVSGAGTGKTTTMINRLIYLKKTQSTFNFEKSALITFTNKASKSMREKLITVLEKYYKLTKNPEYLNMMDEASRAVISTIHGFSKKLINEFGKSINFNKNIQVKSFKYYRKKAIIESLNYVYKNYKDLYSIIKYYPLYDVENKMLSIWEKLDNYSIDVNSSQYSIKFGQDKKDFSRLVEIVIKKAQEHLETYKDYEIDCRFNKKIII